MNSTEKKKELSLATPEFELQTQLLVEEDPESLKEILDIFNLNIKKKDMLRASKLSEFQDEIVKNMVDRVKQNSDTFTNKDLLDYYSVIQTTLEKSMKTEIEVPTIQINQQQINIVNDDDKLSRESREKVANVIKGILNSSEFSKENSSKSAVDAEYTEVKEFEDEVSR